MTRLTFACGFYDRTEALRTGDVKVKDIDLDFIAIDSPRDLFEVGGLRHQSRAAMCAWSVRTTTVRVDQGIRRWPPEGPR